MTELSECRICGSEIYAGPSVQRGYCNACQQSFGLLASREPGRRPPLPCARCGHGKLVRCQVRQRAASGGEHGNSYLAPLALAYLRRVATGLFTGKRKELDEVDMDRPVGLLEAYVCQSCGSVEWFANRPEAIPIGLEYGTELVEAQEKPYR